MSPRDVAEKLLEAVAVACTSDIMALPVCHEEMANPVLHAAVWGVCHTVASGAGDYASILNQTEPACDVLTATLAVNDVVRPFLYELALQAHHTPIPALLAQQEHSLVALKLAMKQAVIPVRDQLSHCEDPNAAADDLVAEVAGLTLQVVSEAVGTDAPVWSFNSLLDSMFTPEPTFDDLLAADPSSGSFNGCLPITMEANSSISNDSGLGFARATCGLEGQNAGSTWIELDSIVPSCEQPRVELKPLPSAAKLQSWLSDEYEDSPPPDSRSRPQPRGNPTEYTLGGSQDSRTY